MDNKKERKIIKEDYVSYEVAKLLKEKGFVTPCNWIYCGDGTFGHKNSLWDKEMFLAPTHQMAMKWLREKYNIFIDIRRSLNTYLYGAIIRKDPSDTYNKISEQFETYEEAVEEALKYALENLI